MWDTVDDTDNPGPSHLSRDMPCPRCGHGVHTFLACGDGCECEPVALPGAQTAA